MRKIPFMYFVILSLISNHIFSQPIDQSYQGANKTTPSETPYMFYGGFVSNDGNYPASYGSLFGFTYPSNGYGYSYQIFKGHTESGLYIRFANYSNGGNTWFTWKKLLDSGNDIESSGLLKINGTGNNYINGNVGIGTIPNNKLDVNGEIAIGSGSVNANTTKIFLRNPSGKTWAISSGANMITESSFSIYNWSDNQTTPLLHINSDGNMGIGTINPNYGKLQVEKSTTGQAIYSLVNSTIGDNYGIDAEAIGNGATSNTGVYAVANGGSSNYAIYIPIGYPPLGAYNYAIYSGSVAKSFFAGAIGVGTTNPGRFKLAVDGAINATEVVVTSNIPAPDYVFDDNYKMMSLNEVENFVKTNKHLPEIPSANEIKENGLNMGEMQNKLLQKIEEMTLYMIEQNKKIEALQQKVIELEKK